jgi:hypothetical protein
MHDFTPPLIGPAKVGNHRRVVPTAGAVLLLAAARCPSLAAEEGGVMRRALLFFVIASSPSARTRAWTVGGKDADFPLITPAIAAAASGDWIRVSAALYREDLVLDNAGPEGEDSRRCLAPASGRS